MGTITRSLANNITTGGVILPAGITNSSVSAVTSFSGYTTGGTLKLLSTQTASNSATISFTTGLNSTYDEYQFRFMDIHPRTDTVHFQFNGSVDAGSNYNTTKTSTYINAYNLEAGGAEGLAYDTSFDLAQSTSFQSLGFNIGSDADQSLSGSLLIFNPSSTTYVKHFISDSNYVHNADRSYRDLVAGYMNTTSAVNAIQFKMSSGNFDGTIKLYGVKKS